MINQIPLNKRNGTWYFGGSPSITVAQVRWYLQSSLLTYTHTNTHMIQDQKLSVSGKRSYFSSPWSQPEKRTDEPGDILID